ncbi:hypothetical protein MKP08_05610 [Erythrobacter sp. LQ02-29]|uniref:hypothetical protein n=1 Tax=Erythrobacter sp. LQ02-29 TaxID=2920384 RepID=UPI001F4E4314|nr:hypothetical protein [Erythrobacter sp. LQ02-29]MCP9222221.1 hypothetical protein [Erythrobacter sp. LQ02-29]
MIRHSRFLACAGLALALAACGDKAEKSEGGSARGEVLGGTINDDMLPLDTVRSTSPALTAQPGEGAASGEATTAPGDATAEPSEPQAGETSEAAEPSAVTAPDEG